MPGPVRSSDMFSVAYEATLPAAMALTREQLRLRAVDVMSLMSVVLRAEANIADQRPLFVHHQFDVASFDRLRTFALAMGYAHMAHAPVAGAHRVSEKSDLALGRTLRAKCAFEAQLCVARGLIPASQFETVAIGAGYEKIGRSLLGYTHVFRPNLSRIESVSALRADDVDTMQMLGERLVMIGSDRRAPSLAAHTATADILLRMYTLVDHAYTQVRHGLTYIFRDTPEQVRALAPSIYQLRTPSSPGHIAAPDVENEDEPENEERVDAE